MSAVTRCRRCLTYVYDDAARCHGCGGPVRPCRLLGRGSWTFILLAVGAFAGIRACDLSEDVFRRESEVARQAESTRTAGAFATSWLMGDDAEIGRAVGKDAAFVEDLRSLRARYPDVLPADEIGESVRSRFDPEGARHLQASGSETIAHLASGGADDRPQEEARDPFASASLKRRGTWDVLPSYLRRGGKDVRRWRLDRVSVDTTVRREGRRYRMTLEVCMQGSRPQCLRVARCEDYDTARIISARRP